MAISLYSGLVCPETGSAAFQPESFLTITEKTASFKASRNIFISFIGLALLPKQLNLLKQEVQMSRYFYKFKRARSLFTLLLITLALVCLSSIAFAKNNKYKKHNHHKCHNGRLGTVIHTRQGVIEGFEDENNTWSWQGIPYAAPPVGELRWKAPEFPESWEGVLETKDFCEECPQFNPNGEFIGNEDCLYMNIWRPATRQHNLPVYLWLHPGGNSVGSGSHPWYYGDKLAANANMVVVSINYRLGPLGWFLHQSLEDDDPLNSSGNYGTLDIIHALKWIQQNIKKFGGDPKNVTVAGESGGGSDALTLLVSPEAKGLFHKAVAQSGGLTTFSKEDGYVHSDEIIANIINADSSADPEDFDEPSEWSALADYLMGKSAEEILNAYTPGLLGMIQFPLNFTDGVVIHSEGSNAINDPEKFNQVPIILSSTKEEAKSFLTAYYGTVSDEEYQYIAELYTREIFRKGSVDDPATALAAHENNPGVYAFQLDYGAYNPDGFNAWPTNAYYPNPGGDYANLAVMRGAGHGLDVFFFFNYWFDFGGVGPFTEENRPGYEALSEDMVTYLSFFTRTGRPHNPTSVHWLPWSNEEGGPKRILFYADDVDSIITMSNE